MTSGNSIPVQFRPTPRVLDAAEAVDRVVEHLATSIGARLPVQDVGTYEADVVAYGLASLICRSAEAVAVLAREDLRLLPTAIGSARTSYEAAIRLQWLFAPDDPFEREARWIAFEEEREDRLRRTSSIFRQMGDETASSAESVGATRAKAHRDAIAALLVEKGYSPVPELPNLRAMATSLGIVEKYLMYIVASQSPHGSIVGVEELFVARDAQSRAILGDRVKPSDWGNPFLMCWYALHSGGSRLLSRWGVDPSVFPGDQLGNSTQAAMNELTGRGGDDWNVVRQYLGRRPAGG